MAHRDELEAREARIEALVAELEGIRERAKDDRRALRQIDAALAPRRARRGWALAAIVTTVLSVPAALYAIHGALPRATQAEATADPPGDTPRLDAVQFTDSLEQLDEVQLIGSVETVRGVDGPEEVDRCRAWIGQLEHPREQWRMRVWCNDVVLYDGVLACALVRGTPETCIDDVGSSLSGSPRAYFDSHTRLIRVEDDLRAGWSVEVRLSEFAMSQLPRDSLAVGPQTTTLRMSGPVTELRETREPDGFSVVIDGVLALDRAAPMALGDPAIESARLINQGDHAVLTVRFVAGVLPPYRVVANGSAIDVTIGA